MRLVPVLLLLATTTLSAQTAEEIASILKPIAKSNISAAVARTHGDIAVGGKAARVPLASVSEPITATVLGTLVDEGFITWDTTIAQVFPEWRASMRPEYANVTLTQLLTHEGRIPKSDAAVKDVLALEPLQVEKRKPYAPSAAGYRIAVAIAERITGQTWEQLVRARILEPFAIQGPDLSVEDLAKFARSHLVALHGKDTIVKAATARLLHTARSEATPGNFTLQNIMNYTPVSVAGTKTLIAVAPKQGLAIVVTAKTEDAAKEALKMLIRAYGPPLPEAAPQRPIPPPRRPKIP